MIRAIVSRLLMYLFLLFVVLISLFPVYFVVITSFKTDQEVIESTYRLPQRISFENYDAAWHVGRFKYYIPNTVIITVCTLAVVLSLSSASGFVLAKLKLPFEKAIFVFFLAGFTVPFFGYMVSLFYFLKDLHLINRRLGVILTFGALYLPFGIFLMRSFFRSIPEEMLDAARMDGCSVLQTLVRIIIPLATPAILTLIVVQSLWSWNDLIVPLIILHEEKLRPISVGLTFLQSKYQQNYPLTAAGTTLSAIPIIVIYLIFQKQVIRGIMQGSIK